MVRAVYNVVNQVVHMHPPLASPTYLLTHPPIHTLTSYTCRLPVEGVPQEGGPAADPVCRLQREEAGLGVPRAADGEEVEARGGEVDISRLSFFRQYQ